MVVQMGGTFLMSFHRNIDPNMAGCTLLPELLDVWRLLSAPLRGHAREAKLQKGAEGAGESS